jgi:hypothetical protein
MFTQKQKHLVCGVCDVKHTASSCKPLAHPHPRDGRGDVHVPVHVGEHAIGETTGLQRVP